MPKPRKSAFLERAQQGALEVQRFTPVTGIGRFDARLDVPGRKLHITLKCFFNFVNNDGHPVWTAQEMMEYKAATKRIVEATWSDCYTLAVDKDDWRDIFATVPVTVVPVGDAGSAHYTVEVKKIHQGETSGSGIDRARWTGMFSNYDIYPEEKASRDQGALAFRAKQIEDKINATRTAFLAFDANSSKLTVTGAAALTSLANNLRTIFTKELSDSGYRIYCYGKTARTETGISNMTTGKSRAKAVADFLNQKSGFPVATVVDSFKKEPWMATDLGRILTAANVPPQDRSTRHFQGCVLLTKDVGPTGGNMPQGIRRNYVVIAHEFGHMFGLPDEYFGVNCMGLQEAIDLRTVVPTAYRNLTRLKVTPRATVVEQAEGFAALLKQGNVPAPIFMDSTNTVTTSIMYAGMDVLPAHYLTFWEAMLTICYPYLWPGELKIVPNPTGSAKRSNVELFAR
jgi:outer membrane protein OmpA-like peptidoglycan-associated protein